MSLTSQSEASTAVARPSSLSSPSPTSSSGEGEHTSATVSVLFSFLIVFLSVFGVCVMGGVVGHYVAIRRRQVLRAAREDVKQRRLQRQKPEMWDVWAQVPAPLQSQQVWRYLNPLTVQMDASSREDSTPAEEPIIRTPHPLNPLFAMQLARDIIMGRPLPFSSDDVDVNAPHIPEPKIFDPGNDVQIAVLVSMPSPRHNIEIAHNSFVEQGDKDSEELPEFVIGTIRTQIE